MTAKSALRSGLRAFWSLALLAVVALAMALQVGRLILPEIHQYRPEVEALLSRTLDAQVKVGQLEGRWRGLRPQIAADGIAVYQDGHRVLGATRVDLELNVLVALFDWQDGLRRLAFHQLHTTLVQRPDGAWGVKHLRQRAPSGPLELRDPLDLFLTGRRIALTETVLDIEFLQGPTTQVRIPEITLENDIGFHRLAALARLDGAPALRLILEGSGDPRRPRAFNGSGYLALQDLPAGQALESLAALEPYQRLPPSLRSGLEAGGRVTTELWFQFGGGRGITWRGGLNLALPSVSLDDAQLPSGIRAGMSGTYRAGALVAQLSNVTLAMPAAPPPFAVSLHWQADGERQVRVRDVDIDAWRSAALINGWLPQLWRQWAEGLAPGGRIRAAAATLPQTGPWTVALEVEQAQVKAFRGVPALTGISGLVEFDARGGRARADIDGPASLALPGLYPQPLEFQRVEGPLSWTLASDYSRLGLEVGPLALTNTDLSGVLRLALEVPLTDNAQAPPALTLTVGVPSAAAQLYPRYTPEVLPDPARRWLAEAAPEGQLSQVGVVFRGELRPGGARHLELGFEFNDIGLFFAPGWPRLEAATGHFALRNERVSASGAASLAGLSAERVRMVIEPQSGGPQLKLTGDLSGDAGQALALVRTSPLDQPLAALAQWQGEGSLRGELSLNVPLAEASEPTVDLALDLEQVRLVLPGDLALQGISGSLMYGVDGLTSGPLRGRLLERDFEASFLTAGDYTEMPFRGRASAAALAAWIDRPEMSALKGEAALIGKLTIPRKGGRPPVLRFESDLVGIAADLPAPFGKTAEVAQSFAGEVVLSEPRETRLQVDNLATLVMVQAEGELQGLALGLLGSEPRYKPGIVNFTGTLPADDIAAWQGLLERYRAAGNAAAAATSGTPLPVRANLSLEGLQLGPLPLDGVNVSAASRPDGWLLRFNHPRLKGTAHLKSAANAPIRLTVSRLALPDKLSGTGSGAETNVGTGTAFKPEQLPPLDFSIDALSVGERELGAWRGQLRPVADGVYASGITGRAPNFQLRGRGSASAELLWLHGAAGELTYFEGQLVAQNVGATLTDFGFPKLLESETGALDMELTWPGGPGAIALDRLRGTAGIELHRGRFIRGASAGENPLLKLIGLLNFDTLARRLRLDFSDLNPEGMAFEKVVGPLAFRAGELWVDQPLLLESPSANLRFAGQIDLSRQRVEAQLVATLPVGGNLTAAAALTGGLPLAAGVWFASKLLQAPMDRFSSFRYRVTGPWGDPRIKLDRMFEDRVDASAPQ